MGAVASDGRSGLLDCPNPECQHSQARKVSHGRGSGRLMLKVEYMDPGSMHVSGATVPLPCG